MLEICKILLGPISKKSLFFAVVGHFVGMGHPVDARPNLCETLWKPQVTIAKAGIAQDNQGPPILFADLNGNVYDCLHANLDAAAFTLISVLIKGISRIQKSMAQESGTQPTHFCTVSHGSWPTTGPHFIVHLPRDEAMFFSQDCQVRLSTLTQSLKR